MSRVSYLPLYNEKQLFLAFRRDAKWCLLYFPITPWDHQVFVLACICSSVTPSPSIVFVTIFVHLLHNVFLSVSITLWFSLKLFFFLDFCHMSYSISCKHCFLNWHKNERKITEIIHCDTDDKKIIMRDCLMPYEISHSQIKLKMCARRPLYMKLLLQKFY